MNNIRHIKVFVREEDSQSKRRLISTIDSSSKFKSMSWFTRLTKCTDEHLKKAAKEQIDGWRFNGPWPHAKFEMEAYDHRGCPVTL
tara:strand:+ start:20730 stop:20987 length:258 start_codon:yes stop_codon:yes gene_type:complete